LILLYQPVPFADSKLKGLKGCIATLRNGEIKAIIMKENKLFGIISGKQEFRNQQQ
jgi:hypothetical protein